MKVLSDTLTVLNPHEPRPADDAGGPPFASVLAAVDRPTHGAEADRTRPARSGEPPAGPADDGTQAADDPVPDAVITDAAAVAVLIAPPRPTVVDAASATGAGVATTPAPSTDPALEPAPPAAASAAPAAPPAPNAGPPPPAPDTTTPGPAPAAADPAIATPPTVQDALRAAGVSRGVRDIVVEVAVATPAPPGAPPAEEPAAVAGAIATDATPASAPAPTSTPAPARQPHDGAAGPLGAPSGAGPAPDATPTAPTIGATGAPVATPAAEPAPPADRAMTAATATAATGALTTTPVRPAEGTTPQPVVTVSRVDAVAVAAARASTDAGRPIRLSVRLDPPNLGEVRVELTSRNGQISVRLEPTSEAVGPALNQQRSAVAAALERAGFSLSGFDVANPEQQRPRQDAPKRATARPFDDPDDRPEPTQPADGLRL